MSKLILILAIVFSLLLACFDVFWLHGHWSDGRLQANTQHVIDGKAYLEGNETVKTSVDDHWVVITGNVADAGKAREIGESVLKTAGVRGVLNEVAHLNEPALERLSRMLSDPPVSGDVRYRIEEPGIVHVYGRVSDPTVRQHVLATIGAIRGVTKVVPHWDEPPPPEPVEQEAPKEAVERRIRDILRLENIYFDFNEATIRAESQRTIDRIAEVLAEYPDVTVRVEGHTDSMGSDAYNQGLSERRSRSVVDALSQRGISLGRLSPIGYGESQPVGNNASPEGRAENRRIEFVVING